MKARMIVLTLALLLIGASQCFAQDAQMGTWKLNVEHSKLANGVARNHTVVYAAAGDQVKVTVDGTNPDGTAAHNEWTGKFDGADYPSPVTPLLIRGLTKWQIQIRWI